LTKHGMEEMPPEKFHKAFIRLLLTTSTRMVLSLSLLEMFQLFDSWL
jgi:hypothetical protein